MNKTLDKLEGRVTYLAEGISENSNSFDLAELQEALELLYETRYLAKSSLVKEMGKKLGIPVVELNSSNLTKLNKK
jgi:hypothetical protein